MFLADGALQRREELLHKTSILPAAPPPLRTTPPVFPPATNPRPPAPALFPSATKDLPPCAKGLPSGAEGLPYHQNHHPSEFVESSLVESYNVIELKVLSY